ncbi:MAG: ClpXP protease specificity-enhancing factor SspB [Rickettsiaceae bacterium]|nr:ClpXP protease specificity-enhancing factor SspB [Rickettsiaceae bacterium]
MVDTSEIHINYSELVDQAMRGIVKKLLIHASKNGIREPHYFLLTFSTGFHGVQISDRLKKKYPEEMTIILQHQFENLQVVNSSVTVRLSFDGIKETIVFPLDALTAFIDPSTRFALQFHPEVTRRPISQITSDSLPDNDKQNTKIISLDAFRKKITDD